MFGQIGPTEFDVRFTAFGVPVRVHPVFWATSAYLAWNMTPRGPLFVPLLIIGVLCIFLAILVHELGHALMNRRFGWESEIVLYFFGGYATSMRHSTWRDIAVSAAGPGAGFLLFGVVCLLSQSLFGQFPSSIGLIPATGPFGDERMNELVWQALAVSFFINLVWNLVNLLPVSPLDGGQISREFFLWLRPRNGMSLHLLVSIFASGAVTLYSLYCWRAGTGVFGLHPVFLAIMFGFLCYQNFQMYQQERGGGGYW